MGGQVRVPGAFGNGGKTGRYSYQPQSPPDSPAIHNQPPSIPKKGLPLLPDWVNPDPNGKHPGVLDNVLLEPKNLTKRPFVPGDGNGSDGVPVMPSEPGVPIWSSRELDKMLSPKARDRLLRTPDGFLPEVLRDIIDGRNISRLIGYPAAPSPTTNGVPTTYLPGSNTSRRVQTEPGSDDVTSKYRPRPMRPITHVIHPPLYPAPADDNLNIPTLIDDSVGGVSGLTSLTTAFFRIQPEDIMTGVQLLALPSQEQAQKLLADASFVAAFAVLGRAQKTLGSEHPAVVSLLSALKESVQGVSFVLAKAVKEELKLSRPIDVSDLNLTLAMSAALSAVATARPTFLDPPSTSFYLSTVKPAAVASLSLTAVAVKEVTDEIIKNPGQTALKIVIIGGVIVVCVAQPELAAAALAASKIVIK